MSAHARGDDINEKKPCLMESVIRPTVKSRGIDCHTLIARSDRSVLQEIVHKEIEVIDTAILAAHAGGFSQITYALPTTFAINNMNKKDAQTLVWSELLMIYKESPPYGKGYDKVYIIPDVAPKIFIEWVNNMDDAERAKRRDYIRKCTISKK